MITSQSEPFALSSLALICQYGLDWAAKQGVEPYGILWVLPRTELLSQFKANWSKAIVASTHAGAVHAWLGFAPKVLTADRLSQPWSQAEWMRLLSKIVPILQNLPHISGHLSAVALWALADEYVQLAFRLHVLSTSPAGSVIGQAGVFASAETHVIMVLREHCADVFESWLCPPCFLAESYEPHSHAIHALVWVDDGEPWPKSLLQRWYPQALLLHIPLPAIQGPGPWQQLAERPIQHQWQQAADEASACDWAAAWVLHWLQNIDEHEPITIVAVDRLLARRLCAILASRGVLVDDRTGWLLSTARVAAWFDALIQAAMGSEGVQTFVHPFQFIVDDEHHTPEHKPLIWPKPWHLGGPDVFEAKYTLHAWANEVIHALDVVGCVADLDADLAGFALLNVLRAWAYVNPQVMDSEAQALSAHDCMLAWRYAAEQVRFRLQDASSPVRMLPLLSTRLQPIGKVLVLGCAQSHFQQSPPGLLPPSVMSELGLLSPKAARIQKLSALYELLWHGSSMVVVHAEHTQGKPQAALPEMLYLTLLCKQPTGQPTFKRHVLQGLPIVTSPLQLSTAMNGMAYPEHLRVTAFDDWAMCALRFGLKHAMPWPWRKSVQLVYAMQGILVHQWLQEVAFKVSQTKPVGFMACRAILEAALVKVWARLNVAQQVSMYLFRQQLHNSIKPVSRVLSDRIQDGWQVRAAEERVVGNLHVGGQHIAVVGRVDWVEVRNAPEGQQTCIVDIKWKSRTAVQRLANDPEAAPQLPIYQYLMQQPNTQLAYWFLQPNHSTYVPLVALPSEIQAEGFDNWGDWVHANIQGALQEFFAPHKPWPQNPGDACVHCAAKGICRPIVMTDAKSDEPPQHEG